MPAPTNLSPLDSIFYQIEAAVNYDDAGSRNRYAEKGARIQILLSVFTCMDTPVAVESIERLESIKDQLDSSDKQRRSMFDRVINGIKRRGQ